MDRYMLTGFLLPRPSKYASPAGEDEFYRAHDPKPVTSVVQVFSVAWVLAFLALFLDPASH